MSLMRRKFESATVRCRLRECERMIDMPLRAGCVALCKRNIMIAYVLPPLSRQ